jgi:hypothetical protein
MNQPLGDRADRLIDLEAGERPDLIGDQMLWWVMNDRGNVHLTTGTPPVGIEVHGTAFAFDLAPPAANTTFYRYRVFYRGSARFEEAYVSLFSDTDLGNFDDDYVGSDTTVGFSYTYNADNFDEGSSGYGPAPPAIGYDFVRGPIVPSVGDSARVGRRTVPNARHLEMSSFMMYYSGGCLMCDPQFGSDFYNYMRAFWRDGQKITVGGDGRDFSSIPTDFMFPGDPVTGAYWSEVNANGEGQARAPSDRRSVMSSGPFRMEPGDEQEIIVAVVWARGRDHLQSVTELRKADAAMQKFADANFATMPTPDTPILRATGLDSKVVLEWTNAPASNNHLERFDRNQPALDATYTFQGYEVLQYEDTADSVGTVIATYDIVDGVDTVIDGPPRDEQVVVAQGTDAGVQTHHFVDNVTNYTTYHFGVRAYVHSDVDAFPRVVKSATSRVSVEPRRSAGVAADSALAVWRDFSTPDLQANVGVRDGLITADVVNPLLVTGETYEVRFFGSECPPGISMVCTEFEITRADGTVAFERSSAQLSSPRIKKFSIDGLRLHIEDVETGFANFLAVQNAAGPLDPPDYAAFAFNDSGFPHGELSDRPIRNYQQASSEATWGFHVVDGASPNSSGLVFGETSNPNSFVGVVTNGGANVQRIGASDYEIRFTNTPGQALRAFDGGDLMLVPFELWNIGVATPDDPSDDYRMIPIVCEDSCGAGTIPGVFDIGGDHVISGGADDPFTDGISWYAPADKTPGQSGYAAFFAGNESALGDQVLARTTLVNREGGSEPPYIADLPETGSVFRIVTTKPFQDGDVFTLDTAVFGSRSQTQAEMADALRTIGIVPNPYRGASSYEASYRDSEVRFTNLNAPSTIRVFALNGTLVRTLDHDGLGVLRWDLRNDHGRRLASGLYLVHIDVHDVGERVIKFGLTRERAVQVR